MTTGASTRNPRNPESVRAAGDAARDRCDWPEAAQHYRVFLDAKPRDFAAWVQLGHACKESGKYVDALTAYSEALGLNQNDADLLLNLGHLHKVMGLRQDAMEFYRRSAAVDNNELARFELRAEGDALAGDGERYAQPRGPANVRRASSHPALGRLRRVLSTREAKRLLVLGNNARDRREWRDAVKHYSEYLRLRPEAFALWVQLGHALKESRDFDGALESYERAKSLNAHDADLLLQLGHIHKLMGDREIALALYGQSAELDGNTDAKEERRRMTEGVGDAAPTVASPLATAPRSYGQPPDLVPRLSLDDSFSMSPIAWNDYLGPLFLRRLHQPLSGILTQFRPRVWIVLDLTAANAEKTAKTIAAVERFSNAAEFPIKVAVLAGPSGRSDQGPFGHPLLDDSVCGRSRSEITSVMEDTDYVLWLHAGDAPRPEMAPALLLNLQTNAELITFDGYFYEHERVRPVFLPGVNPVHLMNVDYVFSRCFTQVGAMRAHGLDRNETPLIAIIRGWLRGHSTPPASSAWRHISLPLLDFELGQVAIEAQRAALCSSTVDYRTPKTGRDISKAKVGIIICTKDKGHLLRQLVRACAGTASDRIREIIVVSNNTGNFYAKQTLNDLVRDNKIKVVEYNSPFNFSAQSNLGARRCESEFLLMLNDDMTPITSDWLDALLEPFEDPDVGISGPLLLYPDERVQHAGMYLGHNGCAGHTQRFARLPEQEYLFYASAPRETSSLTGAAMLISRECFEALNGFDELLVTFLQDVDFCLRANRSGFKCVFVPKAKLIHMESTSISDHIADPDVNENRGREHAYFYKRWRRALNGDEFHSPNFDVQDEGLHRLSDTSL